ncbi:MAG: two-component regulator propeller domain-containing protein [Rhodothermales bacterium]
MKGLWMFALLTFSGWLAPLVQAQPQDVAFEQVRIPGGSTSNFVTGIAQDRQGFLWLATRAWLIKFDGYDTTTYRHDPEDPTSLAASKWVESVYVDREGTLWVGTHGGGLDRFHPASETFTHFAHEPANPTSLSGDTVTVMLESRDGTFWVGTHQGLNRMDREAGTFTRFRHDPGDPLSLSNDQVRALYEDREGTLWIGTGSPWGRESPPGAGGLNRFDPETETFSRYLHDPASPNSLSGSHVTALYEDARGTFWVGTSGGDGLHSMDRNAGTFTRHLYDPTDPHRLSMPHLDEFTGPAYVSVVHEDRSGALWIGAINGGLNQYDPATGRLIHYEDPPGPLGSTLVSGVFESREGVRWVVTWDGLFKIVPRQNALRHQMLESLEAGGVNLVTAFLEDSRGTFWVGTEAGGLIRFDGGDGAWSANDRIEPTRRYLHAPGDQHSLSDDNVLSLYEGRDGEIWVGTTSGLDRLDPWTGHITRYRHDPEDPGSLGAGPVSSLCEDRRGALWVGVYGGGLSRFDPRTGRFTRYLHDPDRPNSLSDDDVIAVHEDREGMLWIGTLRGGINRFDPRRGRFTRYPYPVADSTGLSDGFVTSIYEAGGGTLWIGTHNGGLNRFDPSTGRFTHFTTANSTLPDDRVSGILGDAEGHLWMSTGMGTDSKLTRFAPEQGTFYTYDLELDFPSGTTIPGTYARRADAFFFGGDNGFVAFSPEELVRSTPPNAHPPQVVLTGLTFPHQAVRPGREGSLMRPLRERVRLPHDQNTFSLGFVGLHFEDPAENRYAYMLEGYDDTWRAAGTERQADYYKVPPGQYTFRVKAANSDGVWNEGGAAVKLTVLPPWWRTGWAYLGYVLLFIGGVVAVDRLQRRRLREAEQRRATVREAQLRAELAEGQSHYLEALDQAKSRFFANISHEFRTPLTLLLGPLRDHIEGRIDPLGLAAQAPMMRRNAERLLGLINQLLDLSRLEAGGMLLYARRRDLAAFLRTHVLAFTSRAERDGVALTFTAEPEVIDMVFDADKMEKVISNLLSNAFKFTPTGGRIRVVVRQLDDDAEITVRDTGEGVAAEDVPRVFDRFYQVEYSSTRQHQGTGIGLSLTKELVELHGGTITLESERGFGSTFTVRLPLLRTAADDGGADDTADPAEVSFREQPNGEHDDPVPVVEETREADGRPQGEVEAPPSAPLILIVEDNADLRSYLRLHLASEYRLLEAEDGAEGLRKAQEYQPDLVISDVMMPGMDGFTLCKAIKDDAVLSHIPVVLLTARADKESRILGLGAGADDYLPKPFNLEELTARVENLVEIRRRLRERFSDSVRLGPEEILVSSADAAFVERMRDVVETHMGASDFGVSRMAEELGLSERQLYRRVKETADLTPAGYIRMMRLERAAHLLRQDAGRVSEIAYAVGFKSAKYFSRLFRQTFGHVPSDEAGADLP